MNKMERKLFSQTSNAVTLDKASLNSIEGGKTDSVTLHLVATVAPKFQAIQTANGIAVQSNIPTASVQTQEFNNGAVITITAN